MERETICAFIKRLGIKLTVATVPENPHIEDWKDARHYYVTVKRDQMVGDHSRAKRFEPFHTYFSMGSGNVTRLPNGRTVPRIPTAYDVLTSLQADASVDQYSSFEDWARDIGYDPDSRKAERAYNACRSLTTKLRLFLDVDWQAFLNAEDTGEER